VKCKADYVEVTHVIMLIRSIALPLGLLLVVVGFAMLLTRFALAGILTLTFGGLLMLLDQRP
jgi:hypothetical protein